MDEERKMTFGEHLEELRTRLLISIAAVVIGFVICLIFSSYILTFLNAPILQTLKSFDTPNKLKIKNLSDPFILLLQVSLVFGVVLASPVIFWQMWKFVSAGLYKSERRYVYIFAPLTLGLFLAGAALSYFMMAEFGLRFFLSVVPITQYEPDIDALKYLNFMLQFSLVMGLVFELPIVMMFLIKTGIVDINTFRKQRRIAILVIFIIAAVLTPPDVFTMFLMGVPMLFLYELGIILGRMRFKK